MAGVDSLRLRLTSVRHDVGGQAPVADEYFVGWLQGVILPSGSAVVSDRAGRAVFVLFADGHQRRLAQFGEGPGEIRDPTVLVRLDDNRVGVMDSRLRRLSVFGVGTDTVELISSTGVAGAPAAACPSDSSIYGLEYSFRDGTSLAEYFFDGRAVRRMGMPLVSGSRLRIAQLSRGTMLCAMNAGKIWVFPLTGELIAFDVAGELIQRLSVPEVVPGLIQERNSTISIGLVDPERGWSRIPAGVVAVENFLGAIQLQKYSLSVGTPEAVLGEVTTILFDTRTGQRLGVQNDIPRILSTSGDTILLASDGDEPAVLIGRYSVEINGQP